MRQMKIGLLSASLSHKAGGIFEAVRRSAIELHGRNAKRVEVFGLEDERSRDDLPQWGDVKVHLFQGAGPKSLFYAPELFAGVCHAQLDLLHVHGIWTYTSMVGRRWAALTGKPSLISTHGMLDPWPLSHRRWRKALAGLLYERSHLRHAACLLALSPNEVKSIRAYGLTNPVAVIPTGIDVPEVNPTVRTTGSARTLLYLGRLHAVKGLVHLLRGWHELRRTEGRRYDQWTLVIAGWDDGGHGQELKAMSRELKLDDSVQFVGPQYGEDKYQLLAKSHAFVLPSLSEGLPVSALEAFAYGLPVLMTPHCGLQQAVEAGAAIQISATPDGIAEGLRQLLSLDDEARAAIGTRGRQFVQKQFSWATVTSQLYSVYFWLMTGGQKPECVELAR
jgi:glycosyltransferase involved in cell wall biosynthesis